MTAEPMFTLTQFTIFMIVMLLLMRIVAELIVKYQDKKEAHQHQINDTDEHTNTRKYYNKKIS